MANVLTLDVLRLKVVTAEFFSGGACCWPAPLTLQWRVIPTHANGRYVCLPHGNPAVMVARQEIGPAVARRSNTLERSLNASLAPTLDGSGGDKK